MSLLSIFVLASVLASTNADGPYVILATECNITAGTGVAGSGKILIAAGHYQCLSQSLLVLTCAYH